MEYVSAFLFTLLLILWILPDDNTNEIKALADCDIHEWTKKPNNVDDGNYLVCAKCKYLPESDNYES